MTTRHHNCNKVNSRNIQSRAAGSFTSRPTNRNWFFRSNYSHSSKNKPRHHIGCSLSNNRLSNQRNLSSARCILVAPLIVVIWASSRRRPSWQKGQQPPHLHSKPMPRCFPPSNFTSSSNCSSNNNSSRLRQCQKVSRKLARFQDWRSSRVTVSGTQGSKAVTS